MTLSREARLVSGIILITIPAVMYGGVTLLGLLTDGTAGIAPGDLALDETQSALWRAGHAHAGVWLVISLVVQVLLDSAVLSQSLVWVARISAPIAAVAVSAGFFGLAFAPALQWSIYLGAAFLVLSVLITAIGLLRRPAG